MKKKPTKRPRSTKKRTKTVLNVLSLREETGKTYDDLCKALRQNIGDVRYIEILEEELKARDQLIDIMLKERARRAWIPRKGRYSEEEINRIMELQQEGLNDTEIFRRLHPEFKNFKFVKDYVIGAKKKPARILQKTRRISKRAKKLLGELRLEQGFE